MKSVAVLPAILALANAHATFQQLWKNGKDLESTCARLPPSNSPVEDYTSNALQCNVSPAPAEGKCDFEAGDTVTIEMHQHNTRDCKEEGLGGAHWGPVLAYMSKVEDAATADGSSEFFKVYQNTWAKNPDATQGDNDFWGTKDLNYNCGKLDFTIPKNIAPGDYLLRAEAIALHAAGPAGGAQHYMTCYQLTVTGSGTLEPKGVTFPEAYSKTGPGLGFSIHADLDSYPAPGPELIAGGTEATPQLLTFGELAGAPAATATGGAAETPAASTPVSVAASSTAAPATSSAAVEAEPSSAAPVEVSSAVESSAAVTSVAVSSAAAPVESEVVSTPTPEVSSVVAPFPVANSTSSMLPGTASPVVTSSVVVAPTTMLTAVRPTQTAEASGPIKEYYQCGGQGFKGTGECAEGLECKDWNPWYSQCVKPEATKPGPSKGPMPSSAAASKPTATAVSPKPSAEAPEPSAAKPTSAAAAEAKPTSVAPVATEPSKPAASSAPAAGAGEKTYTLETFIAFLEQEAGSESAAKIRRMIEALQ